MRFMPDHYRFPTEEQVWTTSTTTTFSDLIIRSRADIEIETQPSKKHCDYCKGKTRDDSKGNCIACGAPRD
jgi:hypothetical protein